MSLAKQARAIERDLFGALIGATLGVAMTRLILLAIDINLFVFGAVVLIAAWSGGFIAHVTTNQSSNAVSSLRSISIAFRAIGLRLMLWLLGAAAVLGVLAVLTESFDVVGRVAATTALTGFAAGFLFFFSELMDREKRWRAGLLGTASIVTTYLLIAPAIWEVGNRNEEVFFAAIIILLMLPIGLVAMILTEDTRTRVAGWIVAATYGAALVLFLFAVWESQWKLSSELAESGFTILGFGALVAGSLVNAFRGDRRHWRWIGVGASVVGASILFAQIWADTHVSEEWITAIVGLAVVVAHANLLLLVPLQAVQHWCRAATILAAVVTSAALDIAVFTSGAVGFFGRLSLACGILASTGTLAVAIFHRMNGSSVQAIQNGGALSDISLQCPQCGKTQTLPLEAESSCECGLQIMVNVRRT